MLTPCYACPLSAVEVDRRKHLELSAEQDSISAWQQQLAHKQGMQDDSDCGVKLNQL